MTNGGTHESSSARENLGDIEIEIAPVVEPSTPGDVLWQQDAERARREALASIQRSAERWGATILAVAGLLASVTAIQGTRDLAQISDTFWKISGGVLTGIALALAGASVVLAAFAAQGKAVKVVPSGPELRRVSDEQARSAHFRLKASRVCAFFIIPVYLAALAVVTYAPRIPVNGSVLITLADGTAVCGSGIKVQERDIALSRPGQSDQSIPFSGVLTVDSNSSCAPR